MSVSHVIVHAASGDGDINTLVDLPSAGSVRFRLTAIVDPSTRPSVSNTARVEGPAEKRPQLLGNASRATLVAVSH